MGLASGFPLPRRQDRLREALPARYPLDVIGDLALLGHPIVGYLVAHRGGHALHTAFVSQILEETDA